MARVIWYILALFFISFSLCGCKKEVQNSDSKSSVRLEFIYAGDSTPSISSIDIFIFNTNEILIGEYNLTQPSNTIQSYNLNISDGDYTALAVANLSNDLYSQVTNNLNFIESVNLLQDSNDIYIGYTQTYIHSDATLQFDMVSHVNELELSELVVNIEYPIESIDDIPLYDTKSSQSTTLFRTTTQICRSSNNDVVYRECSTWTMNEATKATKSFMLFEGDYKVKIWCDYADSYSEDLYYDTSDMDNIQIMPIDSYTANSDYRSVFAGYSLVSLTQGQTIVDIEAYQPIAKYTIVTQDVEKYNLMRESKGYPAIEDLDVVVEYNGYLPSGYNISTERLTSSQLGYSYISSFDNQADGYAVVAKDFVLVNRNASSSIKLNITISGDEVTICKLSGLKVEYQSGYHTLLYANFLTDYISSGGDSGGGDGSDDGGFDLELDWEGEYNFEF